jgi:hypothetical protein
LSRFFHRAAESLALAALLLIAPCLGPVDPSETVELNGEVAIVVR